MSIGKDWVVFIVSSCMFIGVCYFQPDAETFIQLTIHGLLALGALTFIYYIFSPWLRRAQRYLRTESTGDNRSNTSQVREEEVRARQDAARQQTQSKYNHQAQEYDERIVKPREEAKKKKKEEDYYRFAGPAWKGHADQLGDGTGDATSPRKRTTGSSQEAAASRHIPEPEITPATTAVSKGKEKRKIELPTEPAPDTEDCITVALRTPQGRTFRHRFLISHSIQTVLDFMTVVGFSQSRYMICQTYPRCCISDHPEKTLEEMGLTHAVTLNVEEKD